METKFAVVHCVSVILRYCVYTAVQRALLSVACRVAPDADVYLGLGSLKEKFQFISLRRVQFLLKFSYFSAQFSTLILQSSKLAHSVQQRRIFSCQFIHLLSQ